MCSQQNDRPGGAPRGGKGEGVPSGSFESPARSGTKDGSRALGRGTIALLQSACHRDEQLENKVGRRRA